MWAMFGRCPSKNIPVKLNEIMDYDTLYGLSDCELRHRIRHFPQQPQRFGDVELYRDEQRRRQQDRQTWAMIALTIVATIATMASVFIAIFK